MSHRKPAAEANQAGFTLVELLVVISVIVVLFVSFGTFFTNYLSLYFGLQKDAGNFTELASQSERMSEVLRGLTDIISESGNDLQAYAYFSPDDTNVSLVHYYLNATATSVMVDVTPMNANPPTGSPITSSKKTYTIITNYYAPASGTLFTYYDASGSVLATPVANEHTITEIGISLAEPGTHTKTGQNLGTTVSLRNRKTNL